VAVEKESVKNVLLELLDSILAELEVADPVLALPYDQNQQVYHSDLISGSNGKSNGRSVPISGPFS
jgi:hypothetical protein